MDKQENQDSFDEERAKAAVRAMRASCVGLSGVDSELDDDRELARDYGRGIMEDMQVDVDNRSTVTDSFLADTIESTLPDLIEIFTDEDVVTFDPIAENDVDRAREETEFIRHVIFQKNAGWMNINAAFRDALEEKIGVWKYWGEVEENTQEQVLDDVPVDQVPALIMKKQQEGWEAFSEQAGEGAYKLTFRKSERKVMPRFKPVAPGDFGTSNESLTAGDNVYCVERVTMRRQDAVERFGDIAMNINVYIPDEETEEAEDREDLEADLPKMLQEVEIFENYIRMDLDGDGIKLWRIFTNHDDSICLDYEEAQTVDYAIITPFIRPHKMLGESMADKCIELQRIRTVLTRAVMDSVYFAHNQRSEISEADSNEHTEADYLDNSPGGYVRSKTGNAVKPIQAGQLGFDVFGALEYSAAAGEQRTGVGRQTQGLNSDALHDTATGQQSMMTLAKRRLRMIARSFAETGFKDLCLGLHRIVRESGAQNMSGYIGGSFKEINPSELAKRDDMRITLGGGSREEAIAAMQAVLNLAKQIMEAQGGMTGPVMDLTGLYTVLTRYTDLLPVKGVKDIFIPPQEAQMPEPQPDPEVIKAQMDAQLKEKDMQLKVQLKQMEIESEERIAQMRLDYEATIETQKAQMAIMMGRAPRANVPGGSIAA